MYLSIVTDELKLPIADAFEIIGRWGLEYVELRGVTDGRVPEGDIQTAKHLAEQRRLKVSSLSPGVFKCKPDKAEIAKGLERLKQTLDVCPLFNCNQIIVFSVQNPDGPEAGGSASPVVLEGLKEASKMAAEAGVRLAIENEPGYTAVGAKSLADLIDAVGMDNVGGNWDPGNAWPYDPDIDQGPKILGKRIFNVHVKDCTIRDGQRVHDAVGKGSIDWKNQIDQLKEISYKGAVVIETHCVPGMNKSMENLNILSPWVLSPPGV